MKGQTREFGGAGSEPQPPVFAPEFSARRKSVALLIESSRGYARGVLRGIARFARSHGGWRILHQEWALNDPTPPWLKRGACDGIIAQVETKKLFASLRRLNVPIVDVRGLHELGVPAVGTDDRAVAHVAGDHLLERGFRKVGFCGLAGVEYSENRCKYFREYMKGMGRETFVYEGVAARADATTSEKESQALLHEEELAGWVSSLPRPIGIMACNDIRGRQLISACRRLGVAIPDQVAVVGVDNDEVLCELADPPMSSVVPATDRIGYEAASLLEQLMAGKAVPPGEIRFEPMSVTTRPSTDVLAIEDPQVAAAVHFIRDNACSGINVDDVLKHLAMNTSIPASRSTLNRHFTDALGRSPKDEILRVRVERVRRLLLETDYTLAEIARMVGMDYPEHLLVLFKRLTGKTPGEFRTRLGRAE